jgi:hypothetical protein
MFSGISFNLLEQCGEGRPWRGAGSGLAPIKQS